MLAEPGPAVPPSDEWMERWRAWIASDDPKAKAIRDRDPWGWTLWWMPDGGVSEGFLAVHEQLEEAAVPRGSWYGWAYDQRLDLLELLLERSRRQSAGRWPDDPEHHLAALRLERFCRQYVANRDRQRATCEALGWPWPPPPGTHRVWRWCWEGQGGHPLRRYPERTIVAAPVCYPPDWRPGAEPDAYGEGRRWTAGEVLHLDANEVAALLEAKAPAPSPAATPPPPDRPPASGATEDTPPPGGAARRARTGATTLWPGRAAPPELDGRQ